MNLVERLNEIINNQDAEIEDLERRLNERWKEYESLAAQHLRTEGELERTLAQNERLRDTINQLRTELNR